MKEEGTFSIVRHGQHYQVRYASNNPHGRERFPWVCPDEAHLVALLHHVGTEAAVRTQVCTTVRHGKMAVLLVMVSAEQLHAFFPPTPQAHPWTPAACGDLVSSPDAAVLLHASPFSGPGEDAPARIAVVYCPHPTCPWCAGG
jgi:hypothetical protein